MGFRPPVATHRLEWPEGNTLHGLVVRVRSVTVADYNEIMRLMLSDAPSSAERLADNEKLLDRLGENLVDWNYEDPVTGVPLTADRAGIDRADSTHMTAIISAWVTQLVSVPDPLPSKSPNGRTASDLEESALALAGVSTSQPS